MKHKSIFWLFEIEEEYLSQLLPHPVMILLAAVTQSMEFKASYRLCYSLIDSIGQANLEAPR